jgi:hypothetical protein
MPTPPGFHRYVAEGVYPEDWGGVDQDTFDDEDFGEA